MINLKRNVFTGLPVRYSLGDASGYDVVFMADFFTEEVNGGAELTSNAMIEALEQSNKKVLKLRCSEINENIITQLKDKKWIIGNWALCEPHNLSKIMKSVTDYSVVEFDFKYCLFRSVVKHKLQTGNECDCHKSEHGKYVADFLVKAKNLFFMSEEQQQKYSNVFEEIKNKNSTVVGSMFDNESLSFIINTYQNRQVPEEKVFAILGSENWIKGTEDAVNWCKQTGTKHVVLPPMPYKDFITTLSKFYGLVFVPRDSDTAPRVTIEAKLLGLDMVINNNVLQRNEKWFQTSDLKETLSELVRRKELFVTLVTE